MKNKETYSYRGWLNSDSFHKRLFAILGYSLLGNLYLLIIIYGIIFILGIIFGFFSPE